MATNTRKLSDFLAEGEGDTFGDLPVENPHIKPGTLYPAVNGMINYDSQNTFTDSAGTPKTITAAGNVHHIGNPKIGTTSI